MLRPAQIITEKWPRSSQYLYHAYCLFILFMLNFFYLVNLSIFSIIFSKIMLKSVFFSFLVRAPYEAPVDSAEDVVNREDIVRAHFCGSKTCFANLQMYFESFKVEHMTSSSPRQPILSTWKSMKWLRMRNMGKNYTTKT